MKNILKGIVLNFVLIIALIANAKMVHANEDMEKYSKYNVFVSGDDYYSVYINGKKAMAEQYLLPKDDGPWNVFRKWGRVKQDIITFDHPIERTKEDKLAYTSSASLNCYKYKGNLDENTFIAIKAADFDGTMEVAGVKLRYKYTDNDGNEQFKGTDKTWWVYNGEGEPKSLNGKKWYEEDFEGNDWVLVRVIEPREHPRPSRPYRWNDMWPDESGREDWIWSTKFEYTKAAHSEEWIGTPVFIRNSNPLPKHKVTYYFNDETNFENSEKQSISEQYREKETVKVTEQLPVKAGYKFLGWVDKQNRVVTSKDIFRMPSGNVNYKAKWQQEEQTKQTEQQEEQTEQTEQQEKQTKPTEQSKIIDDEVPEAAPISLENKEQDESKEQEEEKEKEIEIEDDKLPEAGGMPLMLYIIAGGSLVGTGVIVKSKIMK